MKKVILIFVLFAMVVLGNKEIFAAKKAGDPSPIYTVEETNLIKDFIILPKEKYDEKEANNMIKRILAVDKELLSKFKEYGGTVKLLTTNVTGDPSNESLKGVTPRGWEGTGRTWDDVLGYGGILVLARIGYSEPSMENGHGAYNLELHELAHGIDYYVLDNISQSPEFKELLKERFQLYENDPYFAYAEEYFADTFARYYLNETSNKMLKAKAPKTYEFYKNIKNYIR